MSIPRLAVPKVVLELLPCVSVHVPVTVPFCTGPATCWGGVNELMGVVGPSGVHAKVTVTGSFVHVPAVYGFPPDVALAVIVGAVREMSIPLNVVVAELPAWSVHVPATDWFEPALVTVTLNGLVPAGALWLALVDAEMGVPPSPEPPSVQEKLTVTSWSVRVPDV